MGSCSSCFPSITQAVSGIASENFNKWLENQYGLSSPTVPHFFAGSLGDAVDSAGSQGRLVLMWLHGDKGTLTDSLVRDVWKSDVLRRHIDRGRILCWAGDACRHYDLVEELKVTRFPTLALLRPSTDLTTSIGGDRRPVKYSVSFISQREVGRRLLLTNLDKIFELEDTEKKLHAMVDDMLHSAKVHVEEARRRRELQNILQAQEEEEAPCFCALYASEYGENHPEFLDEDFAGAVTESRRQGKLLLVWLRSPSNKLADAALAVSVWPNEVVQAFVTEHFLVWAGDVDRWLGPWLLRHILKVSEVPALVVVKPVSLSDVDGIGFLFGSTLDGTPCEYPAGIAWQVLGWLDTSRPELVADGVSVCEFLCDVSDEWETQKCHADAESTARRRESDARQELRLKQDVEYEESLKIDQEAELRRQTGVAALVSKEAPALTPSESEGDHFPKTTAKETSPLISRRRAAAVHLHAQDPPPNISGARCTLVIRFPTGRRCERTFRSTDSVSAVYEWADCAGELSAFDADGRSTVGPLAGPSDASHNRAVFDVPEHFILFVTFPRQPLGDRSIDLRAAGLCPNAVLALSPIDPPELAIES